MAKYKAHLSYAQCVYYGDIWWMSGCYDKGLWERRGVRVEVCVWSEKHFGGWWLVGWWMDRINKCSVLMKGCLWSTVEGIHDCFTERCSDGKLIERKDPSDRCCDSEMTRIKRLFVEWIWGAEKLSF